jgi:hypothetical protein
VARDTRLRICASVALALLLATGARQAAVADAVPPPDAGVAEAVDVLAPPGPPELDEGDRSRLAAGEVLVRDLPSSDADGVAVLLIGIVDAPPAAVWAVMADCEEQEEFLPRISYAAVRDRDGDTHVCDLVFDLPFPLDDARAATLQRVRRLADGGYQRRWQIAPGDWSYRHYSGSWTVHPWAGEGKSLLVSRMDVLPKTALPAWFVRNAQTQQAPATFEAIRERVRALAARSRGGTE